MAHTDRDDDRIFWRDHHRHDCPNSYRRARDEYGPWWFRSYSPQACETCLREPRHRWYVSTDAYSEWAKDCRREERARAKTAMRECRDWDDLVINYRRPYYD